MRLNTFFYKFVEKHAELDPAELENLRNDGQNSYNQTLAKANAKIVINIKRTEEIAANAGIPDYKPNKLEVFTWEEKLVLKCENWIIRYGIAYLSMFLQPIVRAYMNGELESKEIHDDETQRAARLLKLMDAMDMKKSL